MTASLSATAGLAIDGRSMDQLRKDAKSDPKAATEAAARQFEALFMKEVLKNMRETTMKSGMWDSPSSDMYNDMLDQQLSQSISGGSGLADLIARQLSRHMDASGGAGAAGPNKVEGGSFKLDKPEAIPIKPAGRNPMDVPVRIGSAPASSNAADFVRSHWDSARQAEQITGIPAGHILGQAAHESGWGKREIRNADGSSSHNMFGIKATDSWKGKVAEVTTTEYVNGVPKKMVARFRAYDSYDEAFRDYAQLIKNSPRYQGVVQQGETVAGFTQGLQRAGYATDPAYADKLARVINHTLQLRRATT